MNETLSSQEGAAVSWAQSTQKARAALKAKHNGYEYLFGLKAAKEKAGLTWSQFSAKADVTTSTLKDLAYFTPEKPIHRASPQLAEKLASVLGVSVKKLKRRKR